MKYLLLLLFVFMGCSFDKTISHTITFNEVSSPIIEQYGYPEDVDEFISGSYHTVDFWYWSQGVCVSFINSPYDNTNGWRVDSYYYFSPM